jgi:hypothetical protein
MAIDLSSFDSTFKKSAKLKLLVYKDNIIREKKQWRIVTI